MTIYTIEQLDKNLEEVLLFKKVFYIITLITLGGFFIGLSIDAIIDINQINDIKHMKSFMFTIFFLFCFISMQVVENKINIKKLVIEMSERPKFKEYI